jgi:hypothetical protein
MVMQSPVWINPGAWAITQRSSIASVRRNARLLIREAVGDSRPVKTHIGERQDGNRWLVKFRLGKRRCVVEMPGIRHEELAKESGLPVPPRLYVNGDSWLWKYAVGFVRLTLTGREV